MNGYFNPSRPFYGLSQVSSGNILSGQIGTDQIASGAITGRLLASGTVRAQSGLLVSLNADGTITIGINIPLL